MDLTFKDFKDRANNPELSKWEKIGFPDSYRKGRERAIFQDIYNKLNLTGSHIHRMMDIGCGCGDLVSELIHFSLDNHIELTLNDSTEMLANISPELLQNSALVKTLPGRFPQIAEETDAKYDAILVYSVIQYPFLEQSIYKFIHRCISLLNSGGRLLIGDIPNRSVRDRFLNSAEGESFKKNKPPIPAEVHFDHEPEDRIDDAVVLSILQRYRNHDCETYLLPQPPELPFAGRREDILIIKR